MDEKWKRIMERIRQNHPSASHILGPYDNAFQRLDERGKAAFIETLASYGYEDKPRSDNPEVI